MVIELSQENTGPPVLAAQGGGRSSLTSQQRHFCALTSSGAFLNGSFCKAERKRCSKPGVDGSVSASVFIRFTLYRFLVLKEDK